MKRLLSWILTLFVALAFVGCSSIPTPTETFQSDVEKVKKQSKEDLVKELTDDDVFGALIQEDPDNLFKKVMDFDYKVKDEKIAEDEKSAELTVEITTYPFGDQLKVALTNLFMQALSGEIDTEDEDQITKMVYDELKKPEEKTYKKEVKISYKRTDDGWKTDLANNEEFMDAVMGGMYTTVNEMNEMWGTEDSE